MSHISVMLKEVIDYLDPRPGQNFIDCTYGGGGHAKEILKRTAPDGKLLAIDLDNNLRITDYGLRITLVNDNFRNLKDICERAFPYPVSGILCDLGVSSMELDDPERGFSFQTNGPLDMRMDNKQDLTAAEVLNKYSFQRIKDIFINYGEINKVWSEKAAEEIVKRRGRRRLENTYDLVSLILEMVYPMAWKTKKITVLTRNFYRNRKRIKHPATQFFQALRIEVNKELENLEYMLQAARDAIGPQGRVAVITFHSLEDRMVKNHFRDWARGEAQAWNLLTKKPITPSEEEIRINPRARSGKLRVIERRQ